MPSMHWMQFSGLRVHGDHEFLEGVPSGAGFSLWGLVLASTKPHRLKPAPLGNDWLVRFDFAVADVDDAVGPPRNVVFVRDQDDGVAIAVQSRE